MLNTEWGLMVWTFITFGIAVLILWKFAFGPLQRVIDERRARIQESMDAAEETRAQADRVVTKAHEQIERETRAALQQLKAQVAELTLLATEKVAASSLSEADQRRLIDAALAEMDFDRIGTEPNG
jgi:F-type H+-transporting ATPase subunit b